MSHLTTALRATTAAALMGSFACLGTATANADPSDTLAASLSKGYSSSNCKSGQLSGSVAAEFDCGQNPDSSGPASAVYQLFNNSTDLAAAFTSTINGVSLTSCGDSGQSPGTWHQGDSGTAGQVACGPYQGAATLTWTIDAKKVLGHLRASNTDVAALYKWWQSNG